jgi:pyruvate/2-oxoglutarate dehydrogenase complex dihydrolipoamide acyltransferase (E2) component
MAEIIRMPKMSDTMTEGVVAKWHKKVGDTVKSGELMAEIETDKATMDYESFNTGTVLYLGVEEGKAVAVDDVLAEPRDRRRPGLLTTEKHMRVSPTVASSATKFVRVPMIPL